MVDGPLCQWVGERGPVWQLWWNLSWSLGWLASLDWSHYEGRFSPRGPTQTLLMYLRTTFPYFSLLWCSFGHFRQFGRKKTMIWRLPFVSDNDDQNDDKMGRDDGWHWVTTMVLIPIKITHWWSWLSFWWWWWRSWWWWWFRTLDTILHTN